MDDEAAADERLLHDALKRPPEADLERAERDVRAQSHIGYGTPPYRTPLLDLHDAFAAQPKVIDGAPPELRDVTVCDLDGDGRVLRARAYGGSGGLLSETLVRHDGGGVCGVSYDRDDGDWRPVRAFIERWSDGRVRSSADLFGGVVNRTTFDYDDQGRLRGAVACRSSGSRSSTERFTVEWDGGRSPLAVLAGGAVIWRRRGAHRQLKEAAEQQLVADLAGPLAAAAAGFARLSVLLRHQDDGWWTDQCLADVRVREHDDVTADAEDYEPVDVDWSPQTLEALEALDDTGEPPDGAARQLLRLVAARLAAIPALRSLTPTVRVAGFDDPESDVDDPPEQIR